jgi:hypothetical protein
MGLQQQQKPARGKLISIDVNPEIEVDFQYNPAQLQDKRTVTYSTINTPGAFVPNRQYTQGGDRTITFSVDIDGLMQPGPMQGPPGSTKFPPKPQIETDPVTGCITPELNKYRAFVNPKTGNWKKAANSTFANLYKDVNQFNAPPLAKFIFGEMVILCVVTDLTITETLFDPKLGVLRAKVAITLIEQIDYGNQPTPPPGA